MTFYPTVSPPDPMGRGDPLIPGMVDVNFQFPPGKVGLDIASTYDWRQRAMNVERQKKRAQRRMILAALMQSPFYFTIPLLERRLLFKRILEAFSSK